MIEPEKPSEVKVVEPVRVRVNMGFTRNVGNYESMRIEVGLEGSANEGEKAGEAFDRVYKFVEAKLVEKFALTEETLSKGGLGEGE